MTDTAMDVPVVETDDKPIEVKLDPQPTPVKKDEQGKAIAGPEDEGIESLKEQAKRAREESARRLAEKDRQIQEAHNRAVQAETEARTTKKDLVSGVITSLTRDKEVARRDYQSAMETGDWAKATDAQDRLSTANARLVEAEKGHLALDEEGRVQQQQQPTYVDNVEKLARSLSPRSAAWVRAHPEFADGENNTKMVRAHYAAIGEGIPAESDDYFRFVNQRLGLERQETALEPLQSRQQTDRAPLSAPVGRDVSSAPRRSTPGTVRLTAEEVATARALDMSLEQYAKNLVELAHEGKVTRQF